MNLSVIIIEIVVMFLFAWLLHIAGVQSLPPCIKSASVKQ